MLKIKERTGNYPATVAAGKLRIYYNSFLL